MHQQGNLIGLRGACPQMLAHVQQLRFDLEGHPARADFISQALALLPGSKATEETEAARAWMAVDWLARAAAPCFLELSPLAAAHAATLRELPRIKDARTAQRAMPRLAAAHAAAIAALDAAEDPAWLDARATLAAVAGPELCAAEDNARDADWMPALAAVRAAARTAAWGAAEDGAREAAGDAAHATAFAASQAAISTASMAVLSAAAKQSQRATLQLLQTMKSAGGSANRAHSIFIDASQQEANATSYIPRAMFLEWCELRDEVPAPPLRPTKPKRARSL